MTPEGRVKAQVKKILDSYKPDLWYFMPIPRYQAGIPDFIGCYYGKLFAVETKAGNNKPTGLQANVISSINRAWGHAIVVNEKNMDELVQLINKLGGI